ncbi:nuclear transport factor 2 family protein [Micromonospora chaiyaphumensis]|uniref:SnoaL-like domain-containing protein n=1 Tax=Micromonospora chaiyaphumensis TaxID=307119 RepID=A0A1C4ZJQ0_9ACTN|nr:nuclear transport factor 2 family protein [Micromonospora chaiyaphumensis]SCF33036.1 SnoaL-like domain-containing protein [Micromonospora chaiyaphumensis]
MSSPTPMPEQVADRLAIRDLVDAYAHLADRRDAQGQAALFTDDARVAVYDGEPDTTEPVQVLNGRDELAEAFGSLRNYDRTTHFNGQCTVTVDGDGATGETYCLAHHLWVEEGQRTLMVMSIRYQDTFVRQGGRWFFAERRLITDWVDRRPSTA